MNRPFTTKIEYFTIPCFIILVSVFITSVIGPTAAVEQVGYANKHPNLLSYRDRKIYIKALNLAKKGQWKKALLISEKAKESLPRKMLRWSYLKLPGNHGKFTQLSEFIENNAHWPSIPILRRRAEESLGGDRKSKLAAIWFKKFPPISGIGKINHARAIAKLGNNNLGNSLIKKAWVENTFSKDQAQLIYKEYKKLFSPQDHVIRLDRLLWMNHIHSARRMLPLIPPGYRKLALARYTLMTLGSGVDAKIAAVPSEYRQDPGLLFERIRWRRRKGLNKEAVTLLSTARDDLGLTPDKWWPERHIQVRRLLSRKEHKNAYSLVTNHGLTVGTAAYAEAEWLAGWIVLRFLKEPLKAYRHFNKLYGFVRTPISLSRASYWAARAAIAAGNTQLGIWWLKKAAVYPSTYHGQLAAEKLLLSGHISKWRLPSDLQPSKFVLQKFNKIELVRLIKMLHELDATTRTIPFFLHLSRTIEVPGHRQLVSLLAHQIGRSDLAVRTAKIGLQKGTPIFRLGYPMIKLETDQLEKALVLSVIRQESGFNHLAKSRAGASGLMQLMPFTAKRMAKDIGIPFTRKRLFTQSYNIRLGVAYLQRLIKNYGGSYVMALAAYNAGPGRVEKWVQLFGDPRKDNVDVIDWIESISISETRTYIQRVMGNLQIYRQLSNRHSNTLNLWFDLHRNLSGS